MERKSFLCPTQGPDFIIIGAKKSATSAIYKHLTEHPQIIPAVKKEIHFFSNQDKYKRGMDWYLSHFYPIRENAETGRRYLTGEASPGYLWSKKACSRISNFFPNVKLIVSLRNPIDRAVSHYYHQVKTAKDETCSLEEALDINLTDKSAKYLKPGRYINGITKWVEKFEDRASLYVLKCEDLQTNADKIRKELFNFLEVPDRKYIDFSSKHYSNKYPDIDPKLRAQLAEFFQPYNQKLEAYLGGDFDWN